MGKIFFVFPFCTQKLKMGKVFFVCCLLTDPEYGKSFLISSVPTDPEYGKGFLCFLVCTQILNMGKVLFFLVCTQILNMGKVFFFLVCSQILNMGNVFFFSGLLTEPEHGKGSRCFLVSLQILVYRIKFPPKERNSFYSCCKMGKCFQLTTTQGTLFLAFISNGNIKYFS
jgi:hypothetical protein